MKNAYCYWSVCDGGYASLMERCVSSARASGVFDEFHVLTDRPIESCRCYDAQEISKDRQLFKLIYLKIGMSKLAFDYFVWIDADTIFVRRPRNLLDCLGQAPMHVPLMANLSELPPDDTVKSMTIERYVCLMKDAGVFNPVYFGSGAFWVIHHDAIDTVFELGRKFLALANEGGVVADASDALSFAMQMLCGRPEKHRVSSQPDLWASDPNEDGAEEDRWRSGWRWIEPLSGASYEIRPAIVHLPRRKSRPGLDAGDDHAVRPGGGEATLAGIGVGI